MSRIMIVSLFGVFFVAAVALAAPPASDLAQDYPLTACSRVAFSTEEDFMMTRGEPFDGNPYISDGDLLSIFGQVCARNADLLAVFYDGEPPADLGLDAVDVLNVTDYVVAFSTELDDPWDTRFTAGDLLITNGAIIPNVALVSAFGIKYDIGLDALHFVGDPESIQAFVDNALQFSPDEWMGGLLQEELERFGIDIWFSIEGTYLRADEPGILDGDLLSAMGFIVSGNDTLLPPIVPAGIPVRGVDFGLDAVTAPREPDTQRVFFSTEILYQEKPDFTDGDVIRQGNGVIATNDFLIQLFYPAADFLGLDAFSLVLHSHKQPRITHIGQVSFSDIDGGNVSPGGSGTGLANDFGYERPFGRWQPIYGDITSDVYEFRVVYREAGLPRPVDPATAEGIAVLLATDWQIADYSYLWDNCSEKTPYWSDSDGWFDGAEYRRLERAEGMVPPAIDCNPQLALTVWNSRALLNPEGRYVIWLQWRTVPGGAILQEALDHHVQFDNEAPANLALDIPGGACTSYEPGDMPIMVQAHIEDAHFWRYQLQIFGGDPSVEHSYSIVNYDDAGPAAANVDGTGTIGPGNVDLHTVDVNDLPANSVVDCCYGIELWAEDRTIVGRFHPSQNNFPWDYGYEIDTFITFSYDAP